MSIQQSKQTAISLAEQIRNGQTDVPSVVESCLQSIEEQDAEIHAFLSVAPDLARRQAEKVQKEIEQGKAASPLAGVPIAFKDNLCVTDMPATCASRILTSFVPPYQATAVKKLLQAGLIPIGKTNMDEFAMGSTTETSAFGITKNPHHPAHVPGGSSGGSCAAVAAGMVPLALGTDTGGSIRQPSAYCGVTGMKPTYGAVSRYGLIAYGSSLDQIGPIANSVADCAALLDIMQGKDERDATSVGLPQQNLLESLSLEKERLRIGLPLSYYGEGLQPEIKEGIFHAADLLQKAGILVEECALDLVDLAIPTYYIIACAEASSNLERFDGVKYGYRSETYQGLEEMVAKTRSEGFGTEVKRRIMLGSFVLSSGYYDAYYVKALRAKAKIKEAFTRLFADYDLVLAPAAPTTAPKIGASLSDPLRMYLQDIYTVSANLCGLPGISIPVGEDKEGLPIGMQILGDCFSDHKVLSTAYLCETLLAREEASDGKNL